MRNILEGGKISAYQLGMLLIPTVLATGILFVPAITAKAAGKDGWLSVLVIATIPGLIAAELCIRLAQRFPGKTLIEYSEIILGKYFGKMVSGIFLYFLMFITSIVIREFSSFFGDVFLPGTPMVVITGSFMLVAVYMVRNGLEVISRMNELTIVLFFLVLFLILLLVSPEMNFNNLLPIGEKGIKGIILGGLPTAGFRGEVVVLAVLLPFLKSPAKARRLAYGAVFVLGVVLALDTIATIAVLGELTSYETYPVFALVRYISLAKIVERIEAVIILIWVSSVLIKLGVFYYCSVLGTAQWFNLKDYKPLVLPIGVLLTVWSFINFENAPDMVKFLSTTFVPWSLAHEIMLPFFLLVTAMVIGKRGEGT